MAYTETGKTLVAGGSGFIGSNIVSALWRAERPVAALSRDPGKTRAKLKGLDIDYAKGDVRKPKSLVKALKGVSTLVSCVQFPNHPVENPAKGYTYEIFDAQGTRNLVQAAKEAGEVQHIIYISGAGVREGRTEPWFRAKLAAEEAVIKSGIPYTIFRPSWVYGREDRSLNRFVAMAQLLPAVPIIGAGSNRVQPLFIMDLVLCVTQSIDLDRARNQIYDIGGPETLTMDQIVQTILKVIGKRKRIVHQPLWLMKLASKPLAVLPEPPLSPQAIDFITMEELVDNTKLIEDFKTRLTPLAQALRTYLPSKGSATPA